MSKVTVFGVGYVGLVQAAVFSDAGHHVCCVDIDENKIENLKKGIIPIYEPGLESLIKHNYSEKRLSFTTNIEEGVNYAEYQFIAVGTPADEDGSADLQYVLQVAENIARYMTESKIIIDKSTVPVGTAEKVEERIKNILNKRKQHIPFSVVSNPEFLKEGSAIADCQKPDRIIIGSKNDAVTEKMHELYAPFNRNHNRIIVMDVRSAELTKYAANSMLATKISFMNEMSNISDKLGADIEAIRQGIGADSRIGYHFIYPGCGYGGSCFPKDVQALIRTAGGVNYNCDLLKSVESVNNQQKNILFYKIQQHFNNDLHGKTFAIWGLSFKPNTDDMREAPSRVLMESLWKAGAKVQAYDPEAMEECQRIYGQRDELRLSGTKEEALKGADALVLVTEWQQFKIADEQTIKELLNKPLIFDGRNQYIPKTMQLNGIKYYSIGR